MVMKNLYCIKCNKYRKFKNPKISHIFDEILVLSIIYYKCGSNDEKLFKKMTQLRYKKFGVQLII